MITNVSHLTLFVSNQDEALTFYKKLGFEVHTDAAFGPMRWLTLHLPNQKNFELVLFLAETEQEKALIGKQGGSRPFFSIETDDCRGDYNKLKQLGIKFSGEPTEEPWGISVGFEDLYGNHLYMCQPAK